jgi:hypothetical protein
LSKNVPIPFATSAEKSAETSTAAHKRRITARIPLGGKLLFLELKSIYRYPRPKSKDNPRKTFPNATEQLDTRANIARQANVPFSIVSALIHARMLIFFPLPH